MAVDKLVDSAQLNSDLTSVANAIRAKSGGSGSLSFPSGFVSEIESIPSGGGESGSVKALNFIDIDGTIIASYSKAEALALESLPPNPTKTGLVAQGWNWTLSDIKTYYTGCPDGEVNVGQMYTTDDGSTRIYIHLEEERKSPVIGLAPRGTVDIDWGDGTEHSSLTSLGSTQYTSPHEYAHGGDYVITLSGSGTIEFNGYTGNKEFSHLIVASSGGNTANRYYVNSIRRIEIGDKVTKLGNYCFYQCAHLTSITIPNSVTDIGTYSFYYCRSIKAITMPNSITTWGGYYSFAYCASMRYVSIPNEMKTVGDHMYAECYLLKSVTVPYGVTTIGTSAFYKLPISKLIALPTTVTAIGNNAFDSCTSLSEVTIPSSVTSIGTGAFQYCDSLTKMVLHNNITTLSPSVFAYCKSLINLTLPSGITTIYNNFCYQAYELNNLIIPNGVTSIGSSAFRACYTFSNITIPSSVTSISSTAFYDCYGVKEYHFLGTTPPTLQSDTVFSGISADCIMYVPVGSLETYQTAENWSTYASYMQEEVS